MADALWELAPPIFLGTLLALVALIMLMNRQAELLAGPQRLANALFGGPGGAGGCRCGGGSGGCRCAGGGGKEGYGCGHQMPK